jgi:hypothetical protein
MQSYPPCAPNAEKDTFDEVTQPGGRTLKERLAERARASTLPPEGIPPEDVPGARWDDSANFPATLVPAPRARWVDPMNHYQGSRSARSSSTMETLHTALRARRYDAFRDELARAELAGEISEFYALNYQAILAVVERSEFASNYLEMARAAASSPYELAVIAENRAAHDLLQGDPLAAATHCLATLDHVHQTEGLWNNLLIALYRLGEVEAIDATLRSFTQLNDECTARLVRLLSSEPELREVRARPAFKELLVRRAAG